MSRQETIFQTPVVVFEALQGTTEELGNGMCALVGQSGVPPRYKIVCFNDKRQSLCTATLTGSNEHSLQFQLQSAEYACFKSDEGTPYSILFLKSADVDLFVAHLATAFYGASGQPSHSTVIADLAHTTKRDRGPGNEVLDLGKRGKVRYTCFTLNRGATTADLPTLNEKPIDATSDTTYLFEAVQSAYSLPADGKGFESSAVGMITDTTRLVVVPQAMPRNSTPSEHTLVFVLYLKRVVNDPTSDIAGAVASARAVALVNNSADRARNALVLSGGGDDDGPQRPKTRDPNAPGAGIPAEHMLLLQKIAGQLNSVLSSTRDMHDKIDAFSGEWKQTVNRPKPSVLTNTALEQNLRNLINENERARDELTRRDELITSLDERIRELRKRVDKLAVVAQELMDEKKRMVANASTSRLEMDRQILRLQEQINQATNERDDVHRHLTTVKKLLDMSDEQLRDTKGRFEVISVQVRGTADKLDASEEQLGEERTRRKALEAKVAAMQEEIRNALAEARLKSAELDDVNRKADADRIFHAQVMEDERQRRSIDVAQLRSEIVTELQNREAKFQADRARTASDNFERGREEGMDIGKRNARIDNEHRMQELQLEAQRCRTELDAYKTQLRDTQDDALAENRRLEAAVAALKRSTEEATKQKARNEFSVHSLQLRVKHAEDALLLGLSALVNKLSRTIDPTDLLDALDDLHNGRPVDLSFELARAGEEEGQTRRRREDAIFDEAVKVHAEIAAQTFKDWYDPCTAAFAELNADIARLWYERDMRNLDEVLTGETSCRAGIETESDSSFVEIGIRWRREAAERDDIVQEEAHARPAIVTEFDHFVDWLSGLLVEQSASRQNICMACDADYDSIVGEENSDFTTMRNAFERVVFEKLIAEQEVIMGEEEQLRIAVADEENREFDSVRGAAALEQSSIRDMLAERERALRTQRADLEGLESQGRVVVEMDEEGEFESAQSEFKLTMPKPPTPPPPPREPTPPPRDPTPPPPQPPQPTVAPATQQQQPQQAPPPMPPAGKAAAKAPAGKPGTKSKGPMKVTLTDSEADTPRGEPTPRPKPAPKRSVLDSDDEASAPAAAPPHKLSTTKRLSNPLGDSVGVAASDSGDSDNEPGIAVRKAPMAKPANKAASPPGNRGALFDEDSDSEKAPAPTFKPATKPAAKPTAKTTSLFDGDSDEGTPRPSAKPAAKPAPKRVVAAASDSD